MGHLDEMNDFVYTRIGEVNRAIEQSKVRMKGVRGARRRKFIMNQRYLEGKKKAFEEMALVLGEML